MIRSATYNVIPLQHLRPGQTAEVIQVVGQAEHVLRMNELGLRAGSDVEVVQAGSPCIVRVTGQTLCFRGAELLRVLVRPAFAG